MAKIIAFANQKGGVGKTTSCVNLCAALSSLGKRILMVDCDPQGNATSGMGVSKSSRPNTYDMLINGQQPESCIQHTEYADVIPTGKELAAASVELIGAERREFTLKNALQKLYSDYDFIFIDCPPSLELLTVNALVAADSVLIRAGGHRGSHDEHPHVLQKAQPQIAGRGHHSDDVRRARKTYHAGGERAAQTPFHQSL